MNSIHVGFAIRGLFILFYHKKNPLMAIIHIQRADYTKSIREEHYFNFFPAQVSKAKSFKGGI